MSGGHHEPGHIELPAPSSWPIVLAIGVTMIFAFPVTAPLVGIIGAVMSVAATYGWCKEVLIGHGEHVQVPIVDSRPRPVETVPEGPESLVVGQGGHRVRLPVEMHPYSAGALAGVAGGVAMAVAACGYGLVVEGSVWYPINLLSAGLLPSLQTAGAYQLHAFNATALIVGSGLHVTLSALVGLVYVALLPMTPDKPVLVGGLFVPLAWTSLIWASMGILNPTLAEHVNWIAFVLSQLVFGLTAGAVVARTKNIETMQTLSMAERVGLHVATKRAEPAAKAGAEAEEADASEAEAGDSGAPDSDDARDAEEADTTSEDVADTTAEDAAASPDESDDDAPTQVAREDKSTTPDTADDDADTEKDA